MRLYSQLLEYQYVKPKVTNVSCYRVKIQWNYLFLKKKYFIGTLYYYCNIVTFYIIYLYIVTYKIQTGLQVRLQKIRGF